jgi:hypothetical protein
MGDQAIHWLAIGLYRLRLLPQGILDITRVSAHSVFILGLLAPSACIPGLCMSRWFPIVSFSCTIVQ